MPQDKNLGHFCVYQLRKIQKHLLLMMAFGLSIKIIQDFFF
jgi:hypothetical protein